MCRNIFFISFIIIGTALIVGNALLQHHVQHQAIPTATETLAPVVTGNILPRSEPARLTIPAIHVDASFVDLGLTANNEIEVPKSYTEVGWYTKGPTPGELGPAIVLGHVDSHLGPGVFFSLGQLKPGDIVTVTRQDGSIATFRVDKLERYAQNNFPTTLVYGDIDHAGLRLITCTGTYNRGSHRYDSNLVVYASLVD